MRKYPSKAKTISPRQVIKKKSVDSDKLIKAILGARSFEEEQSFRTDNPTCSREVLYLTCSVIASNKWTLNSLDVKTSFFLGKTVQWNPLSLLDLQKKQMQTNYGNSRKVDTTSEMLVDSSQEPHHQHQTRKCLDKGTNSYGHCCMLYR